MKFVQASEAALAFNGDLDRVGSLTDEQIGFPMARLLTVIDVLRPLVDRNSVGDGEFSFSPGFSFGPSFRVLAH